MSYGKAGKRPDNREGDQTDDHDISGEKGIIKRAGRRI